MTYRVTISARAGQDLDRILARLMEHSPSAAAKLAARFREALSRLESHPFGCGLAYENRRFDEELRHLLFHHDRRRRYRALFVVRGDEAVMLAIRAPSEAPLDPDDLPS